jgi:thioester reductase-like protein
VEARLRPQANGVHKLGIDDMVQKYAHLWPSSTLVITGTTGNLGCHLLSACLNDERVRRIYALNRPSTRATAEGHAKLFKERSLSTDVLFSSKVVFLQSEAHQEQLGLNDEMYSKVNTHFLTVVRYRPDICWCLQLCASVTHIFHLAWRLDFNLKLASFENSIRFTRQLLDLGLACRARARFIFASSVAVASSWPAANGPYPEEPVSDSKTVAGASGYGQSKFVSEQVRATLKSRRLLTILRSCSWTRQNAGWKPVHCGLGRLPAHARPASGRRRTGCRSS